MIDPTLLAALAAVAAPQVQDVPPASSQPADPAPEADDVEELVVVGVRARGSVDSDIAPEQVLRPADIRAYGAATVSELLEALSIQTSSARGRGDDQPVVLVNGKRISSLREVRRYPPEAISRVEILPEEVALDYGYRADQRVVNIVLRERFRALTLNPTLEAATQGDRWRPSLAANQLRIRGDDRWTVDGELNYGSPILESDRSVMRSYDAPFSRLGNVAGLTPGAELDPALSALVGAPVFSAAVPAGGSPALADFAAGANQPRVEDDRAYRTLTAETGGASLNGSVTRSFAGAVSSATLNLGLDMDRSVAWRGLPTGTVVVPATSDASPFGDDVRLYRFFAGEGPLERDSRTAALHLGASANGQADDWRWTFTGAADVKRARVSTDRNPDPEALQAAADDGYDFFGGAGLPATAGLRRDRTETTTTNLDAQVVLNRVLWNTGAGKARLNLTFGADADRLKGETHAVEGDSARDLSRTAGRVQSNLSVPLTAKGPFGDLSVNLNGEYAQLSDFGAVTSYGYGLNWTPLKPVSLIASVTEEKGAPSIQQLGDPLSVTPDVQMYDFTTGETVLVDRLEGGAPGLKADSRRVIKLGLSFKPWIQRDLRLSADYVASRIDDPISEFPAYTAGVESAFPARFVRDGDGRLVSVDLRPVNFDSAEREELRWGFTYSRPVKSRPGEGPPPGADPLGAALGRSGERGPRATEGGPPPEGGWRGAGEGGGRRGGGGPGGFGGGGQGRLQVALFHTWRLRDEVVIGPGLPVLDYLDGAAGGRTGGKPVNVVEAQLGYSRRGYGAQAKVVWSEGTRVDGEAADGSGDLFFDDRTDVSLRLFADFAARRDLVQRYPFLRRARVSLDIGNLLDERTEVRTASGQVLPTYQEDMLDPIGRTVKLGFRKMF